MLPSLIAWFFLRAKSPWPGPGQNLSKFSGRLKEKLRRPRVRRLVLAGIIIADVADSFTEYLGITDAGQLHREQFRDKVIGLIGADPYMKTSISLLTKVLGGNIWRTLTDGNMRVVSIKPGRGDDMLRVDMHTTVCGNRVYNSWIRSSGYDALSYAWGDTVNQQWIVLNGSPVRVRKNLHDALLELRERGIKGPIWIDALCINQSNKLEKAQQLPLMNFIYDQADTVYVWLGAGAEHKDVTQGLLLLETLSEDTKMPDDKERPVIRDEKAWNQVATLFSNPYFGRVWIIQEMVLARNRHMLLGSNDIPANKLLKAVSRIASDPELGGHLPASMFTTIERISKLALTSQIHASTRRRTWPGVKDRDDILAARTVRYHPSYKESPYGSELLWKDNAPLLLRFLLESFRGGAANPHDQVYGLLGLVPGGTKSYTESAWPRMFGWYKTLGLEHDSSPIIEVSYPEETMWQDDPAAFKRSYCQTYKQASRFIMQGEDSLALLGQANMHNKSEASSSWPSWLPNWSRETPTSSFARPFSELVKAFPKEQNTFRLEENSLFLNVHKVDTIVSKIDLSDAHAPSSLIGLLNSQVTSKNTLYPTGCSRHEALWRTLIANTGPFVTDRYGWKLHCIAPPDYAAAFDAYITTLQHPSHNLTTPLSGNDPDNHLSKPPNLLQRWSPFHSQTHTLALATAAAKPYQQALHRLAGSSHTAFFVTSKGYFVLGPSGAAVGDVLVLAGRSPAPLILRKWTNRGEDEDYGGGRDMVEGEVGEVGERKGCWRFVGDAYAHGLVFKKDFEGWDWEVRELEVR